ncbi:MAG: hypothetical protein NTW11_02320 [Candidatus Staskawiczbacteria bacterium]|nr:hypothetical protein [Candidatus Staskawiczbacteria bacterium]
MSTTAKVPQIDNSGAPIWWHKHGSKMRLKVFSHSANIFLVIQGSAAELKVGKLDNRWIVAWKITQSPTENSSGRIIMNDHSLAQAFGLDDDGLFSSCWLIERYGGTVAHQGQFIRWDKFLNIPCPGTGHDGDLNVSIYLDEKIKEAVGKLLGR